ncbi:MAG: DUF47 family protein [Parachlamydia sp.]|nr:DUF47 family protein [Parachlamydia sp.]
MFSWLLPKEVRFFDYFSQHAALVAQAAEELLVTRDLERLNKLEEEADQVAHQCVDGLRNTFITPIDRHDIFRLITRMDDIIDMIDETARYYACCQIGEPTPEFKALAEILVKAAHALEKAVKGLHDLKNSSSIIAECIVINELENEADNLIAETLKCLFESDDLRRIIKWKEIYQRLETSIDRCEDVANLIEGIILEHV